MLSPYEAKRQVLDSKEVKVNRFPFKIENCLKKNMIGLSMLPHTNIKQVNIIHFDIFLCSASFD